MEIAQDEARGVMTVTANPILLLFSYFHSTPRLLKFYFSDTHFSSFGSIETRERECVCVCEACGTLCVHVSALVSQI